MSRARGKHTPREPVAVDSGEGRQIGMSDRLVSDRSPIPGGQQHITNHPTVRQNVPVPVSDKEYGGLEAHGVPAGPGTTQERAEHERGPNQVKAVRPHFAKEQNTPIPIPVYNVRPAGGKRPLSTMATDTFAIPAAGTAAVRIAGRDKDRTHILLLVETPPGATFGAPRGIRVDHEVSNLDTGKGALIPTGASSYLKMECNDELFAVSTDASTCQLSVIYLYEVAGAG